MCWCIIGGCISYPLRPILNDVIYDIIEQINNGLIDLHMAFFLKKLIASWLLPLPLGLLLIVIGLILLWFNKLKSSFCWIAIGALLIFICSLNITPKLLLSHLEDQYPVYTDTNQSIQTIVVLGASTQGLSKAPPNTRLNSSALARLIEAIRLYHWLNHSNNHPKLILSGGKVFNAPASAIVMKNIAEMLGIPRKDMIIEKGSKDTHSEAMYLKTKLKNTPFLLVTSAYHMPRAMMLFKNQGLHPIAAPTQFIAQQFRLQKGSNYAPRAANLARCDIAIHEYLGTWWAKLT